MIKEEKSNIKFDQEMKKLSNSAEKRGINDYFFMTMDWLKFKQNENGEPLSEFSDFFKNNPSYKTLVCSDPQKLTKLKNEFLILVDFLKKRKMQLYFTKSDTLLFDKKFNMNPFFNKYIQSFILIIIGRNIGGISSNEFEYLMNDENTNYRFFESRETAIIFLMENIESVDSITLDDLLDCFLFLETKVDV